MEAPGKLTTDTGSESLAEQFYEQALLLVDCCRIPEAIRLLEQAIKIKPDSEIYRESLAILQMNYLQSEQHGLSYANVARPRPNMGDGKENISSNEWKAKKTRSKENQRKIPWSPATSSGCYSNPYEQSTIDNPWASFVNRNSKGKKSQRSPIDGISEIEIPPMDEHFYTQSPSAKQEYKHHDYKEQLNTPITCNGSQKAMHKDGMSAKYAQENHVNTPAGKFEGNKADYPEDRYTDSDESLDTKFLEELCMARESATDDWAKYYDVLCSGLGEDVTCNQSDVSHHNTLSYQEYSDTLDEINATGDVKCRNRLGKDHSKSEKTASMRSNSVCSKCGHLRDSTNPPSPTKNRIHFVNGACVSSSSVPNCTCNKESKSCSKEKSAKLPLSSSQQEFYHNLQYYFGSGKVKSRKATAEAENEGSSVKSSDIHQKSSTSCRTCDTNVSPTAAKDPLNVKSNRNVSETVQNSTQGESKKERTIPREHVGCKVTGEDKCSESRKAKISFNADEVKTDKKSCSDHERFQPAGYKQKARARDKVRSKTKPATKTEHVKNVKEGASQGNDSQKRQSRVEDGIRSRGNSKGRAEDTSRPVITPEIREKPTQKQKEEKTSQADIDFTVFFTSVYLTGVNVASKCFQVSKSILYYIVFLMILLFGFLIYCVWIAASWLIRKVFHLIAVDKFLAAARSKTSALLEWLRKCRETRRKTSAQGQTYDLPKNGDAAIRHMLQNKDNDPYSVLGVPSDASDDDIRKQYRKLAVLIHPDKNPHSQADEAFKILANAFDILSDAEKRSEYDRESAWKRRAEEQEGRFGHHPASPEQFFADLGKKMQEMQNYLQCNSCDGKHRRYSTDRFVLTARFCGRCNTRHAAKEGDLWAESSFLGYKLHFYACMEGEVFDVTEWAACQGIGSYRMEPNPHTVHLKLKTRQPHPSGFNARSEEEDFENFMRAFFGQFNPSKEERYHGSNKQPKRKRKKRR